MAVRIAAAPVILNRGHEKPAQAVTGVDATSPVSIVAQQIYEDAPALPHPPQLRAV